MSIVTKSFAVIAACAFAVALSAADKVILSSDNELLPNAKNGKIWKNDNAFKASLPLQVSFKNPVKLVPGKTYTLSAEIRSTGGAALHGQSTKKFVWIGFLQSNPEGLIEFNVPATRISPELAELVKSAKAGDSMLIVKGNLARWAELKGIPLEIASNAKADGSDLPNNNLIKVAVNGISKRADGNWEIKLPVYRYLQQDIPAGTKFGLHFICQCYDFVNEKNVSSEWTAFSGSMTAKTADTVVIGFACPDEHGEIEFRNIKLTEK